MFHLAELFGAEAAEVERCFTSLSFLVPKRSRQDVKSRSAAEAAEVAAIFTP
jgi:hypothetical protein